MHNSNATGHGIMLNEGALGSVVNLPDAKYRYKFSHKKVEALNIPRKIVASLETVEHSDIEQDFIADGGLIRKYRV
jgi:hypothetical protein